MEQYNTYPTEPVYQPSEWSVLMYLGIAVVAFIIITYVTAWMSSRKVAGTYRFVRREQRVTLPVAQANAIDAVLKDSLMTVELGMLGASVQLTREDGTVFQKFTGDLPFWYKTDLVESDLSSPIIVSEGATYHLEYMPYAGGYPNIVITANDEEKQFLRKWVYTVNAEKKVVLLDTSAHPEWTRQKL